jgi:MoaA/NifB/PqqE/SkfB family radical SAM enzyme
VVEANELFDNVLASLTGGEPLLHPGFGRILEVLSDTDVPYRFVTNGWHTRRAMPLLDRYPPQSVRLSLSGADRASHDAERGRGSFDRVLLSIALLTSRRIPTYLSLIVDRRTRGQIRMGADLAESLGCTGIGFILPQPTPGSAARDSDLPPGDWLPVRKEIEAVAADSDRNTTISLDYGAPFDGSESLCDTFDLRRVYIDTRGRLCTCCQLSCYGFNEAEAVADLREMSFAEAYGLYLNRLTELRRAQQPDPQSPHVTDRFPCLRCARASGKLAWLAEHRRSAWHAAADDWRPANV